MLRVWIIGLIGIALMAGCRNDCQKLCAEMRDYAADECDLEFSNEEFRQCLRDFQRSDLRRAAREVEGQSTGDRLDACERGLDNLQDELSCDEIAEYFGGSSESGDTGSGG
ncbi:MAG: hypothetical protein AAFV53_22315 [Myxococcota bacterium]